MTAQSHFNQGRPVGSPDFQCFPEDDDGDVSQLSDDDRCSIDGFESDFDAALDSQTEEEIHVPPARVNYGYPREPYRPSTLASQLRPTAHHRRGTSTQSSSSPWGAYYYYLRGDFQPRQTTTSTQPFGGMSFHSWMASEDDRSTDVSDSASSVTTGRFTYGFPYRNANSSSRSSCMGRRPFSAAEKPKFDEKDEEDSEDSSSSSEWMSTSSASTPKQAPHHVAIDLGTLRAAFHAYESRWAAFHSKGHERLTFRAIPWPQHPTPSSVADINVGNILTFLKLGGTAPAKLAVRQALLRFHPDKTAGLLIHVEERERESVMAACAAVARCLNEINRTL